VISAIRFGLVFTYARVHNKLLCFTGAVYDILYAKYVACNIQSIKDMRACADFSPLAQATLEISGDWAMWYWGTLYILQIWFCATVFGALVSIN
jgi:hypothetical protein